MISTIIDEIKLANFVGVWTLWIAIQFCPMSDPSIAYYFSSILLNSTASSMTFLSVHLLL